ncbi:hypothetical protein PN471_01085 [Aphanizomenon sp. CS-733/32]|uniref:hypothetical protein n=1 Tax=Aphanizomenon sp. CS-733/32 TaxID=3021715 RepID=UPI00232DFB20|nr:hypothetical protein [Aphanizomenon sp. CS-733/32]MDB9307275.1 hypothetical protein [Aphanizomenon sp. CS-733/32]
MCAILSKDTTISFTVEKKFLFLRLTAGVKKEKEKEGKRAKEQECKGLLSPRRTTTYNPKTEKAVAAVDKIILHR